MKKLNNIEVSLEIFCVFMFVIASACVIMCVKPGIITVTTDDIIHHTRISDIEKYHRWSMSSIFNMKAAPL